MKSIVCGMCPLSFFFFVGLLALGLLLGGVGCQKKTPSAYRYGQADPGPASTPAQPAEDKVVATVNGTPIMESQVQQRLEERYGPLLAKYAAQSPELAAQQEKRFHEADPGRSGGGATPQ